MRHFHEQNGEAQAVGWISMSDTFMLTSIVMLAVAVCFALILKKTDVRLNKVQGEYANYKTTNTLTIAELNDRSAQLSKQAGDYKSQASSLDQQLSSVKSKLADSDKTGAKYKAQGERLAAELSALMARLNSVQGEFDSYRNINTASLSDLKTELVRLTKDVDSYKTEIATLHVQMGSLETKLTDSQKEVAGLRTARESYKSDSERLAADLDKQKLLDADEMMRANGKLTRLAADLTRANGELGRVNVELAKSARELTKLGGEKEQLLADLNAWKTNYAVLMKDDADLKQKLNILDVDKKRADAKIADLEGSIVGLTGELGELKPQVAKLKVDLTGAHLRIIDLEKLVFEKINRARLAVTVTAQNVPKDFTIELIVTDPLGNECGPFSSVIFNDGDEIGVLQQSVDFKGGTEGAQKAVFYSMRPVYSRAEPGIYSVKAMIRQNDNDSNVQLPRPVTVQCSVDLPYTNNPEAHKVAQLEITSPGYIKKARRTGQLSASTPYKNMWPWEPSYHFERTVCDFRVSGDAITNFRTFDKIAAESVPYTGPRTVVRAPEEQKIDSIRNRSGN